MMTSMKRMAVMSAALILFYVTVVAQSVKNTSTNEVKREKNLVELNSDDFSLSPDPCYVYKGEKVDVGVTFPIGYDDLIFDNYSKNMTGMYYTAEICVVDGEVVIRVWGRDDYNEKDLKTETLTVKAIKKNAEYNIRSISSAPSAELEIKIMHK